MAELQRLLEKAERTILEKNKRIIQLEEYIKKMGGNLPNEEKIDEKIEEKLKEEEEEEMEKNIEKEEKENSFEKDVNENEKEELNNFENQLPLIKKEENLEETIEKKIENLNIKTKDQESNETNEISQLLEKVF